MLLDQIGATQEQPNALLSSIRWVETMLTGSAATAIVVLGVAAIGLLLLSGHLPFQRGTSVVLGACILFAAPTIAEALATAAEPTPAPIVDEIAPPASIRGRSSAPASDMYDPYGGVAVPSTAPARDLP